MSPAVQELLTSYHNLSEEDRHEVSVAILRDLPDYGDIPQETYDMLYAETLTEAERTEAVNAEASI